MKQVIEYSDIGSTYTYKKNYLGQAVWSTLDKGQYAIDASSVVLKNRLTNETVKLEPTEPISAKTLFDYNMLLPREALEKTLPGMVGKYFMTVGMPENKNEWVVEIKTKDKR